MGMWIGRNRKARVTYGFDEIALEELPGVIGRSVVVSVDATGQFYFVSK